MQPFKANSERELQSWELVVTEQNPMATEFQINNPFPEDFSRHSLLDSHATAPESER